ncbi:unnamed protein product [Diatraea saccharalis]|uniref:Uncharacterized protein n=1 Tax=Diatraea saccharalis TaxID=40085 RepID=A0A9N9QVQ9_9NEOP|nr:unnamed protein product [Diatraea saccharalis]
MSAIGLLMVRGENEESRLISKQVPSNNSKEVTSDEDLDRAFTIWRHWKPERLLKLGRLLSELTRSPDSDSLESMIDKHASIRERHSQQRHKLKNKVKILFKVHQFET